MPSGERVGRGAEIVALLSLALLVAALTLNPITNNDVFLHLRTGAEVLRTGRVPHVDDYSALARGRPFVAHEWLSGVLFRLVELTAGLNALIVLKVLVALAVAAALYAAARALGERPELALPALALVMILTAARIMERPHIFSYLLAALFLLLLARRRAGRTAPLWSFVPLQVLWANLHGGFVLGPLFVGLAAAGEAIDHLWARTSRTAPRNRAAGRNERRAGKGRHAAPDTTPGPQDGRHLREAGRLAALAAALVACCLVNPYGVELLEFPFQLTGSSFMTEIYEWQPPFRSDFAATYMMRYYVVWGALGLAVLGAALERALRRRLRPPAGAFPYLLFAVLLALSLRMQRNVTDFALGTFPGVVALAAWIVPRPESRKVPRSLLAIALCLAALASWFTWNGYPYRASSRKESGFGVGRNIPVEASDYLEANGIAGNAFNSYGAGAYLVYRFYPAVRVAMDSRNDVYGSALYGDYLRAQVESDALARMLGRIDASFVFLEWTKEHAATTLGLLRQTGGWRLVYFDDDVEILVREDGPWTALALRDGFSVLEPSRYRPGSLAREDAVRALEEASRAARAGRGAYVARVMKENALLALGRRQEAFAEEAGILAEHPPLSYIYAYLGILRFGAADRVGAERLFRRALALNPTDPFALRGLERAGAAP